LERQLVGPALQEILLREEGSKVIATFAAALKKGGQVVPKDLLALQALQEKAEKSLESKNTLFYWNIELTVRDRALEIPSDISPDLFRNMYSSAVFPFLMRRDRILRLLDNACDAVKD
jgi:hypothetical protein